MSTSLPIYRLIPPRTNLSRLNDLAKAFGIENYSLNEINGRYSIRSGTQLVDVNIETGAIWAADMSELWNPNRKPQLSDKDNAFKVADEFIKKNNLLHLKMKKDR